MALPNTKGWLAILFVLFCLALPFAIIYYVSTQNFQGRYSRWQRTSHAADTHLTSQVSGSQVILIKDEKIRVGKTCLKFTGIKNNLVMLDLYLLDLDADHPYPQSFSRNSKNSIIRLGDISYTLKSVNSQVLTMKIINPMGLE